MIDTRVRRDLPPAHYTLKIESYSEIFNKDHDDKYESGIFKAANYNWRLVLYPNGNKKRDAGGYISLYLAIDDSNSHSNNSWRVFVNYKFFLLDQIENQYCVAADEQVRSFDKDKKTWGFDRLISLKVLKERSNGFLINDSCAFGVEVFVINPTGHGETLSMISFEPPTSIHTWKIAKFKRLLYKSNYYSEQFTIEGRKWKIRIWPMGYGSGKGNFLSLYLKLYDWERLPPKRKVYAKFKLRVLDRRGINSVERRLSHWFSTANEWGNKEFMRLDDLYEDSNGYLIGDTLIVQVEFVVVSVVNV